MRSIGGLCLELDASARQNHVAIMKREAKTQKVSRALDPSVVRQPHLNLSPLVNMGHQVADPRPFLLMP